MITSGTWSTRKRASALRVQKEPSGTSDGSFAIQGSSALRQFPHSTEKAISHMLCGSSARMLPM